MKKIFMIISAILVCLILASCDNTNNTSIPTDTQTGLPTLTPNNSPTEIPDIKLNYSELMLSEGQSEKISVELLKELSESDRIIYFTEDSSIAYVDQDGNVIAIGEGNTKVTVKTTTGLVAECNVTVSPKNDIFDSFDLSKATKVEWASYYDDGFYADDNGTILFSPTIWDFQQYLKFGASSYQVYLRITHLPSTNLSARYTFPTISIIPQKNAYSSYSMNLSLLGKNNNGTFCPIAGEFYDVEYIIVKKSSQEPLFYGTYSKISAVDNLSSSKYYTPTPMPGYVPKDQGEVYISYIAAEGGQIDGGELQAQLPGKKGYEITAKAHDGYRFYMWNDGVKTPNRSDVAGEKDTSYTAFFIKTSREDMPIANMYIFTETGKPVTSKNYIAAELMIIGAKNEQDDISATLQIKGRGNSSWNAYASQKTYDSKNSYRLKLDQKEKLLGIGDSKNKDWVLNSNKFDLSGLRNYLIWEFADKMGTLPYVPDCQWVQLYINGEYRGMYMVTERVEVANDRVEVDDTIDSTDKGYLIEIDFRGTDEGQPYFYVEGYGSASNGNPREFVIKSQCNDADLEFIADYIRRCHSAIMSGNRDEIDKLIDIPSLIDMYILEELTKDVDVGAASFFMQKAAGGKIYFTAPWDFDFGFGTYGDAISYEGMVSVGEKGCTWYAKLIENEWFRTEVLNRMSELDKDFEKTLDEVKTKGAELKSSADKNAYFWNMYGTRYHSYVSSGVSSALTNYDEHIEFIMDWSHNRWDVMKEFLSTY